MLFRIIRRHQVLSIVVGTLLLLILFIALEVPLAYFKGLFRGV